MGVFYSSCMSFTLCFAGGYEIVLCVYKPFMCTQMDWINRLIKVILLDLLKVKWKYGLEILEDLSCKQLNDRKEEDLRWKKWRTGSKNCGWSVKTFQCIKRSTKGQFCVLFSLHQHWWLRCASFHPFLRWCLVKCIQPSEMKSTNTNFTVLSFWHHLERRFLLSILF